MVREEKIALPQPYEIHAYYVDPQQQNTPSNPSCINRKQKLISVLLFGVVIITLAIAIPITILRKASSKAVHSPSNTAGATLTTTQSTSAISPASTPKSSSIAALSPLAVVSWPDISTESGGYNTKLVFQSEDGLFRTSTYSSVSDEWRIESLESIGAKKGSPIAITRFIAGPENAVRVTMFSKSGKTLR